MTEQERTRELDRLDAALDMALRAALSGKAHDVFYLRENLRLARDLMAANLRPGPLAVDITEIPAFIRDTVQSAYAFLGAEKPAGLAL